MAEKSWIFPLSFPPLLTLLWATLGMGMLGWGGRTLEPGAPEASPWGSEDPQASARLLIPKVLVKERKGRGDPWPSAGLM